MIVFGAAAVLAVIDAVGKVLSAINGIYEFVKNAEEFFSGRSDWDQVRAVISSQIVIRDQILQVSADILDAVRGGFAQLDRRIFLERIADKLGDSDQAVLAFDTWKRTGDANQSAIALNESAGALSDVLRYSSNNVYPNESLAFPLIEIVVVRLLILKEADPDFVRSSISRQPILDVVELLNSTADALEAAIREANEIRDQSTIITQVRTRPQDEGGGREVVQVLNLNVSYRNLDASVTFERRGEFEPEDGRPSDIINQAKADAAAARQRGLASDLARARLTVIRDAANIAERCLLVAEASWVGTKFLKRELTELETAVFVAKRQRDDFELVAASFFEDTEFDRDSLRSVATDVSGRRLDPETEESLWNMAEAFGKTAVLNMLLRVRASKDQRDPASPR